VAAPAFISAGVGAVGWTVTQGQFLAGVGANAGLRGMQGLGASGYAGIWQAESAAVYGAQRLGAWGVTQMGVISASVNAGADKARSYFYNPSVLNPVNQQKVIDFIGSYKVPGPPSTSVAGAAGGATSIVETVIKEVVNEQD